MRRLEILRETFPIRGVFRISRGARTEAHVVAVRLTEGGAVGQGECVPYPRYGESIDGVVAAIEAARPAIEAGIDRAGLTAAMPHGAARNAVDAALWDLEAKRTGTPAWKLAGLTPPQPLVTAYTLSVDTPQAMGAAAAENAWRPLLKLKMTGDGDLDRVAAIRDGAPAARLIVDANEAWSIDQYRSYAPRLADLGVELIEQPFPADADGALAGLDRPIPVCADESCHDRPTLPALAGKYDAINVKLDKTGGLTEALALIAAARGLGLEVMVGCMVGSSLSMAPGVLAGQTARWVDLDAPLLLAQDRTPGLRYEGSTVHPPEPALWG